LLADEDVQLEVLQWLRERSAKADITVKSLQQYVSSTLFPTLGIENKTSISRRTARALLESLGFEYKQHQKGIYVDGHERPDVVQYRGKFLGELKAMDEVLLEYDEKDLTTEVPKVIPIGTRKHILVTHDEACFNANDDGGKS
jgi:hypothetical protein